MFKFFYSVITYRFNEIQYLAWSNLFYSKLIFFLFITWKIQWKLKSQYVFPLFMVFKWISITKRITRHATLIWKRAFFQRNIIKILSNMMIAKVMWDFVCASPKWYLSNTTETFWYPLFIIFPFFLQWLFSDNAYENVCFGAVFWLQKLYFFLQIDEKAHEMTCFINIITR